MAKTDTLSIMSYDVFTGDLSAIKPTGKRWVVNTINPHSYVTAKSDPLFEEALRASDILLPDGSGIVLAARQISNAQILKIAGSDLHIHLLEMLNKEGGSVFYMGASQKTLDAIHERIAREYPHVRVGSYSPPFKPVFSEEENEAIIEKVNAFKPDVLFVGMTAPKQEKWLHAFKERLDFKIAASIGAVFDFYAGTIARPSQFWIDLHLEWLPRLLKEPRRLWRRNFVSTPLFLWDMLLYKWGVKR